MADEADEMIAPWRRIDDAGCVVIDILHPAQPPTDAQTKAGDVVPDSLTFRAGLFAGDLEAIDNVRGEIAQTSALVAELTGEPIRTIRRLDARDWANLKTEIDRRLGN